MADSSVTLRTRKFIRNPLLGRRQMVVYVYRTFLPDRDLIAMEGIP